MQLSATEEAFVNAFRRLPAATAEELAGLVRRIAALAPNTAIDWSDSWSDADLEAYSVASLPSVDADDSEELL
jgi:hypothetical protein